MMIIKGFQKTSLIDFPGNISAIVFLARCNFRCPFCYNRDLVLDSPSLPEIPQEEILRELARRKKYLDGVVLTGGEPLLNEDVLPFMKKIKEMGYLVKLDTNGSNPALLARVLKEKLADYVAMDVKSSPGKYEKAAGVKINIEDIKKSARLVMESGIDYEFRTTVVPGLVDAGDVEKIGKWLKGARAYYLQQFRPMTTLDPECAKVKPYAREKLLEFRRLAEKYFKKVEVRNV
ncbi:MAG: anaerobic ribonucleoside-triphosphate reductase activating protein [Candidatus Micrarchaeota archaeon]